MMDVIALLALLILSKQPQSWLPVWEIELWRLQWESGVSYLQLQQVASKSVP